MDEVAHNGTALWKYGKALGLNMSNPDEVTVAGDLMKECVENDAQGKLLSTLWIHECDEKAYNNKTCEKKWDSEKQKVTLYQKLLDVSRSLGEKLDDAAKVSPEKG